MSNGNRKTGTVKWFNIDKGYGFIERDGGGGKDDFVHITAVTASGLRTLNEGARVAYEMTEQRGKLAATQLEVLT